MLGTAFFASSLMAQEPSAGEADPVQQLSGQRERTLAELNAIAEDISLSQARQAEVEEEIAALRKDEATLRENLIQSAEAQRETSRQIEEIEARFALLREDESAITASLASRRDVLAEVLAGLQRMGRNPPPALLVSSQDALASVRSAILLGSIVPEMRAETERLVADLEELVTVRTSIEDERGQLVAALGEQAAADERTALLLQEKQKLQAQTEARLAEEQAAAAELAARAGGLEELIATLESEIASVRQAAEEAREATRLREQEADEQLSRAREMARSGELDVNRIAPAFAFEDLRGRLQKPVEGTVVRRFGDDDGTGHPLQGITVASRSGAVVTAPADGWVVYSGPFRTYGQLLILTAGDEYHVVLAGMDRIDVSPGQFVVAGEPVAAMGETRLAGAAALALASAQPTLYIEFRNDGRPVDPDPWWTIETSGRVNDDS